MHIDFSAHDTWSTCAAKWFELYVNRRRRRWSKAQRDDALALGSLTHEGLRVWQQEKRVEIPDSVIEEVTPTRECLQLALELVHGYTQAYPAELWPLILCEEPVTFPLKPSRMGGVGGQIEEELIGLAKIDSYFYVPEPTEIEVGTGGLRYTLSVGWWIHEYKTKSPYMSMPLYMQGWEMNLQASYQLLALNHRFHSEDWATAPELETHLDTFIEAQKRPDFTNSVQGILVNVLEKPRRYIPKRTCKSCREVYEFVTWIPTGTGEYACPTCSNRQVLTPLKSDVPTVPPNYYRIIVTRTQDELERDREDIIRIGERMMEMVKGGLRSEPWNKKNCVDTRWNRACEYFSAHKHSVSTLENDFDYMEQGDYRGLIQIEI